MPSVRVINESLLTSPEVMQFIEAARAFCDTIAEIDSLSEVQFLKQVQERLPLVYSRGLGLEWPWQYEGEDDDGEEFVVRHPRPDIELPRGRHDWWKDLQNVIGLKLSWHRCFHFVYDPVLPNDREVINADLADCLADIYIELKRNLMLYDRGSIEDRAEAVWQWKFGLDGWGTHAAEVMLPIQHLLHTHYDEDDEVFNI